MRVWHIARWAGLVVVVLVLAVGLARLFSGEEHDQLVGALSLSVWLTRQVLPWLILAAAVGALVAGGVLSRMSPATREALTRDVRFFGTVSIIAPVLAGVLAVSLAVALASGMCCGPVELSNETLFVLLGILGLLAFLTLVGLHAHSTRKILEAHYDLKRTAMLLQDTVERLSDRLPRSEAR